MPRADIVRSIPVHRSARVMQLESLFDVPPSESSEKQWSVALPFEEKDWNIGLIVGPSGCGKTTIANELFGDAVVKGYKWSKSDSIVDDFPAALGIKEIVKLLSSVGFSSPPSWLRPFGALSNGEQFRVMIARALAEAKPVTVIDEFSSVVDRTVAKIGSYAVAKTVRNRKQKLVAVSCHYDIVEWLQPDWIFDPGTDTFQWRYLQRRPDINLVVRRCDRRGWNVFKKHHYMSAALSTAATCFVGTVDDQPAAFVAVVNHPHPKRSGWRAHRLVCLPDFQGVGIGVALATYVARVFSATGRPFYASTAHPALKVVGAHSPDWRMSAKPGIRHRHGGGAAAGNLGNYAGNRMVTSFRYVGEPASREEARLFGLKVYDEKGRSGSRKLRQ